MTKLTHCVCCGNELGQPFLDLGFQPLANNYHDGSEALEVYPLAVAECACCSHRQLTVAVDSHQMFDNYLYRSAHFQSYFNEFSARIAAHRSGLSVLDIGCNDGTLLTSFARYTNNLYGVDPAVNLRTYAQANGSSIVTALWTDALAARWPHRHDVIVAMNVLAHVADPGDFLRGCRRVLVPGGRIYIQTSQCDWVENSEFDCVYHEHISYFTRESLYALSRRAGLYVETIEKVPIHGNSWLLTLSDTPAQAAHSDFAISVERICKWVSEKVAEARDDGFVVAGYGAAAKGNTFLNRAGLWLDFIMDDNDLKCGKLTPGMNIPIRSPAVLGDIGDRPLLLVLLAWNFETEIVDKVTEMRIGKTTRFLRYFPDQDIYE